MGLNEYAFALFIFVLACLFALLCKYLFGRTKKRFQALDEKEKKLLAFYSTLEDIMDEFNDSAVQANAELAQQITSMRNVAASLRTTAQPAAAQVIPHAQPVAMPAQPQPVVAATMRQATSVAATRPRNTAPSRPNPATASFDPPIFEVITDITPVAPVATQAQTPAPAQLRAEPDRPTRILNLHKNGMDRLHIAKELSVTLSEVDLVLGIAGQR